MTIAMRSTLMMVVLAAAAAAAAQTADELIREERRGDGRARRVREDQDAHDVGQRSR